MLLAVDVREELSPDHLVWAVMGAVDELDLSAFEAAYRIDGRSRPPYEPGAILALIMYCAKKRIRSGAEIADARGDDLGARVIMGGARPHASTINRFQGLHAEAIRALLPQTLRMGEAEGLVDVSVVAGDGTKIVANAAMGRTVDRETLQAQIGDLEQRLLAAEKAWARAVTDRPRHPDHLPRLPGDLPDDPGGGRAAGGVGPSGGGWGRTPSGGGRRLAAGGGVAAAAGLAARGAATDVGASAHDGTGRLAGEGDPRRRAGAGVHRTPTGAAGRTADDHLPPSITPSIFCLGLPDRFVTTTRMIAAVGSDRFRVASRTAGIAGSACSATASIGP